MEPSQAAPMLLYINKYYAAYTQGVSAHSVYRLFMQFGQNRIWFAGIIIIPQLGKDIPLFIAYWIIGASFYVCIVNASLYAHFQGIHITHYMYTLIRSSVAETCSSIHITQALTILFVLLYLRSARNSALGPTICITASPAIPFHIR